MQHKLIIISGPSGAGEDSVIQELEKRLPIVRVVTTTTREMRPGERDGAPYYFISKDAFEQGLREDRFFEHALQDRGNYYGVTHSEIARVRACEGVGIWKVDYKGVLNAKILLPPSETVAIFVSAPLDVIEERLRRRENGDDDAFIAERLAYAQGWFDHRHIFDYEVENKQGRLDQTVDKIEAIIRKELALDRAEAI